MTHYFTVSENIAVHHTSEKSDIFEGKSHFHRPRGSRTKMETVQVRTAYSQLTAVFSA